MKTTKHITFLLLTLILSANTYAQKAKPAKGMAEVLLAPSAEQAQVTNAAQEKAKAQIKAMYEGDKIATTSVTANYSNANSTISIKANNTENGIDQKISIKIAEECELNPSEILKSLANAVDRSTAFNDKIIASKVALLSLSQAANAMIKKGSLAKYAKEEMNVELNLVQVDENNFKVSAKLCSNDKCATANLDLVKGKNASYKITGTAGETPLALKLKANDDYFVISGDSAGEDVKATVSTMIDLSLKLDSSCILKRNGNGTPIRTRVATNNANGTHTVVETPLSGDSATTVYDGNTLVPYEEFNVLASGVVVESTK
ncbi:MAG: hypothetical protein R3Y46_01780 [Opitutales bacterium]